jgi:hypothetical protein
MKTLRKIFEKNQRTGQLVFKLILKKLSAVCSVFSMTSKKLLLSGRQLKDLLKTVEKIRRCHLKNL